MALDIEIGIHAGEPVLEALLDALPRGRARLVLDNLQEGLHG